MYSKTPTEKAPKGAVQVITSHDRLQLRFRYAGKRHYVSIGLPDNPTNRKVAEMKARQIELDIASSNFDETLNKYKPQSALSVAEEEITPKLTPITLGKLWEQYMEYKLPHTINGTYEPVTAHLSKCTADGLQDALKFRMELLQVTTQSHSWG